MSHKDYKNGFKDRAKDDRRCIDNARKEVDKMNTKKACPDFEAEETV